MDALGFMEIQDSMSGNDQKLHSRTKKKNTIQMQSFARILNPKSRQKSSYHIEWI